MWPTLAALTAALLSSTAAFSQALPTGGSVAAGSASISSPRAGTLNINQSSNQAIVNWQSFSVGSGGTVNFNQPGASSATLNRVTGSAPSSIAGTINAPGTVLLVNPNGIAITKNGVVNTGSFAASTLDIKNEDFLAGRYKFTGNGSSATVVNRGRINVSDGGFAALLGGRVANDGVITARLGKVALGSGEMITLDMSGDGFVSVAVPSNQLGNLRDGTGKALVTNKGKIIADGGTVFLSAATAGTLLRDAVNVPGSIRANSVGTQNGRIVIGGGAGGRVKIAGRLTTNGKTGGTVTVSSGGELEVTGTISAKGSAGQGGSISLTGANVALVGALIDASGTTGGGTVLIGGGSQGSGPLAHAQSLSIDSATVIRADVTDTGNGGTIVAWSDGQTTVAGNLSAKGGPNGGDGGSIETSGHSVDFTGITVNASASHGNAGTWLVDPTDLTINDAAAATIASTLNGGTSVTLQTNANGTTAGPGVTSAGNGDIVLNSQISAFNNSSVTLYLDAYNNIVLNGGGANGIFMTGSFTAVAGGSFASNGNLEVQGTTSVRAVGNISLSGSVNLSGKSTFTSGGTFATFANVNLGITPTVNGGFVAFGQFGSPGTVTSSGGLTVNSAGDLYMASIVNNNGGTVTINADADGTGAGTVIFPGGSTITTSGHVDILYHPGSYTDPSFFPGVSGGGSITAWKLVSTSSQFAALNNLSGSNLNFALNNNIDFGGSISPLSTFNGTLNGFGYGVLNAVMSTNQANAALIQTNNGTIENFGVVGGSFNANLAAAAPLAITNNGTITNSFSTASATSTGGDAGGLVDVNNGTINGGSWASGSVTSSNKSGGLVATNNGDVDNSYASGAVSGGYAGGLVGWNGVQGRIQYAYALGSVSGFNAAGGLVGVNDWSSTDAGRNGCCGAGRGGGYISDTYAAGAVSGSSSVGGIVGDNHFDTNSNNVDDFNSNSHSSASVFYSIWDVGTTGQANAFGRSYATVNSNFSSEQVQFIQGIGGNTGHSAYDVSSYELFDHPTDYTLAFESIPFTANWYIVQGATRPFLNAEYSTTIDNAHQLQLIDKNGSATYTLTQDIPVTLPTGSTSMWTSAGFSAISPITLSGIEIQTYVRTDFSTTTSATTETETTSGNLTQRYITQNVLSPLLNTTGDYSLTGTIYSIGQAAQNFTGTLNGQGHTISGIAESFPNPYEGASANAGLFNTIGAGGTVTNVGISSSFFYSTNYAGAIAAENDGTVTGSWSTASVTVGSFTAAGGLVGVNAGTVSQSYSQATVGGFTTAAASAQDTDGGLVGVNYNTITDSYAIGPVLGYRTVGGLVGTNDYLVQNSYSTGQIYVNTNDGGTVIVNGGPLVGFSVSNHLPINSYWDSSLATQFNGTTPVTNSNSYGTGLTTTQMQDLNSYQSTYSGWDFRSIWAPPNQAGQGGLGTAYYPQLFATSHIAVIDAGSETAVYGTSPGALTASVYGLRWFDGSAIALNGVSTSATAGSNVGSYATTTSLANSPASVEGNVAITPCGFACSQGFSVPVGTLIINGVSIRIDPSQSAQSAIDAINAAHVPGLAPAQLVAGKLFLQMTNGSPLVIGEIGGNSGQVNGDAVLENYLGLAHTYPGTFYDDGSYNTVTFNSGPPSAVVSADGATYRLLFVPSAVTVTPESITVAATAGQSKGYGSADPTLAYTVTSGTLYNNATLSGALSRATGQNVGSYAINEGTLGGPSSNYAINFVSSNFAITPATLYVTPNAGQSKTYGNADPTSFGYSVNGLQLGDQSSIVSGALGRLSGENVGSYGYTLGNVGLAGSNYTLSFVNNSTSFAITARDISISAQALNKMYGELDPTLTYSVGGLGLANGDTEASVFAGALTRAAGENAVTGGYAIAQGSLASNSNYHITGFTASALTITPRTITITADALSKIYGNTDPTLTYAVGGNGLGNGDTQAGVFTGALTRAAGENVVAGGYAVTQGTLAANSNYSVTGFTGAQFTVTPRSITVAADSQSKIYGNTDPTLTYTVGGLGLGNGDTEASAFGGGLTRAAGENVTAGGYAITQGSLAANGNYSLTGFTGAQFTITPRSIMVTADSQSKIYGNVDPTLTYTVGGLGLANGDTQATTFTGGLTRVAGETVAGGPYAITQGSLAANSNYSLTGFTGSQLAITARDITLAALAQSKVYGAADPTPTYSVGGLGLANGDTQSTAFTGGLTRAAGENVADGPYAIAQGSLLSSSNYNVTGFTPSTLAITPAPIVVAANGGTSIYGQSPTDPGVSASGLQFGEGAGVLTGLSNSFGILPTSGVAGSPYTLSVLGTLTNANYSITSRVTGTWIVTPASIVVTALGGNSIYGSSPTNPGIAATNLQNGEGVGVLTGLSNSFGILPTTGVAGGPYTLSVLGTLANPNYSISSRNTGSWIVNPALITVAADAQSKQVGAADPALTYQITTGKLFNNDNFFGALTRVAGEYVGFFPITQGTFATSSNYTLTFVGSELQIKSPPTTPSSTVTPNSGGSGNGAPNNNGTISFNTPAPTPVSFTVGGTGGGSAGGGRRASNTDDNNNQPTGTKVATTTPTDPADATPGSIDTSEERLAEANAVNGGLVFLPIGEFDPKQYSGGQLPGYQGRDGQATIFTMIGRAIANQPANEKTGLFIDSFWNADAADKQGASDLGSIKPKLTFSDGAGKDASSDGPTFPILAGTTDLGHLLDHGPLLMQGKPAADGTAPWMLAIRLTDDGKGIIANDPVSGRQVILAYDPATKTVDAVTSIYNPATHGWRPIAEANTVKFAGDIQPTTDQFATLQSFTPVDYVAVTIH
jgi:filamentous hemagglutinin family protein